MGRFASNETPFSLVCLLLLGKLVGQLDIYHPSTHVSFKTSNKIEPSVDYWFKKEVQFLGALKKATLTLYRAMLM